jgi:hypothetical protein
MIQLNDPNNFGCKLRDLIYKNLDNLKEGNSYSSFKKKLDTIEIPEEYWSDILAMSDYRKYDRIKDWVEELLLGIVIRMIVSDLIKENI